MNEFDGYLILDDGNGTTIHLPWHVLPRKAARVEPSTTNLAGSGFPELTELENEGVGTAQNDAYSLVGLSPDLPEGDRGQ